MPDDLYAANRELIEQRILAGGHEEYFLGCWQSHRQFLLALQSSMHSVDLRPIVDAGLGYANRLAFGPKESLTELGEGE